MSVQPILAEAVLAAVRGHRALADQLAGIFDAPPPRAATPHALIGEAMLSDWGTKDMAGREARVAIALHDAGESPARLRRLAAELEAAVAAMPRALGDGWTWVSLALLRTRIERRGEGRWVANAEWRLRLLNSGE